MKLVLAPLAGFTDAPFRRICHEGGADLCYTEMVSAAALAHGHGATRHLMESMSGEGPLACQVFGAREDELAHAARVMTSFASVVPGFRFCEINLNAGCPMTKVTRGGAGAELVKDPAKIGRLIRAMVENTDLPVTLKTRLGPHPQATTVFEILDAAQQAGVRGLIVHARYTSQMHGGAVHLDLLADLVRRAVVPITGNGSVTDARTAAAMQATGVAAVMIGRAALSRPNLFNELKGVRPACENAAVVRRHLAAVLAFRDQLAARYPGDRVPSVDGFASVKMHTHLFRYFNGRPGAAALRARLNGVRTLAEIREIIDAFDPPDTICHVL